MSLNLRRFETAEELVRGVADSVVRMVEARAVRSISLSGGSTPPPIYRLLGSGDMRERLAQYDLTWVVGDERFVPETDAQSNLGMIRRTLFAEGMSPNHRLLEFRTDLGDAHASADDFIRRWNELGLQRIDLQILGVGDDGHTASLFPGTEALQVTDRVAAANYVPRLSMWRLTTTMPVIQQSPHRFVLAVGESKREILRRVDAGDDLPVVAATRGEGETWWFVDRAAAPEV